MPDMSKRSLKEDKNECIIQNKKKGGGGGEAEKSQKFYLNAESKPQIWQVAQKK